MPLATFALSSRTAGLLHGSRTSIRSASEVRAFIWDLEINYALYSGCSVRNYSCIVFFLEAVSLFDFFRCCWCRCCFPGEFSACRLTLSLVRRLCALRSLREIVSLCPLFALSLSQPYLILWSLLRTLSARGQRRFVHDHFHLPCFFCLNFIVFFLFLSSPLSR